LSPLIFQKTRFNERSLFTFTHNGGRDPIQGEGEGGREGEEREGERQKEREGGGGMREGERRE
jgi:hypothetical protein